MELFLCLLMNIFIRTFILGITLLCCVSTSFGQSKNIEIVFSEKTSFFKKPKPHYQLIDQVHLRHDSTDLYCDSALFFIDENRFEAFGNVLLERGDSIELICQELVYFGNTSLAKATKDVYLRKDTVQLYSQDLNYNIHDAYASYSTKGKVINVLDTIDSKKAEFHFNKNEMELFDDVYIRNAEIKSWAEYLKYNTETNNLQLKEAVKITTDSTLMFLDRATYVHNDQRIYGKGNITAYYQNYTVLSDSLQMQTQDSILWVWDHVYAIDSVEQIEIKSEYGELHKKTEEGTFIDSVFLRQIEELDTMYFYADTLVLDRNENFTEINAYQDVKIWRDDIQARADSIHYNQSNNNIKLFNNPVAWMNKQQAVADTLELILKGNELETIYFLGHAFLINDENKVQELFSQVKGRVIVSQVVDNKIASTLVNGNAEVLYCVFEDEVFSGINKMNGVKLKLFFKNNEISKLVYLSTIDGKYIPSQDVTKNNRFLEKFKLKDDLRVYKVDFQVF